MNTTNKKREQLLESLRDPEFRKQFIDEHINVGIAFQIRGIRKRQKLNQVKLAGLLGDKKKQPLISQWENPNYGNYSLATLKDLAKAFDVGLLVRFVPFNKMIEWATDLTNDVIAPPNFSEEQSCVVIEKLSAMSSADLTVTVNDINRFVSTAESDPYKLKIKEPTNVA